MSTMESSHSPSRSSASAEKRYMAECACSPVKANLVEANLNEFCDGEGLESPQLPSLTSSSRGFRASAASPSRMGNTGDAAEEGDQVLASLTPTRRYGQPPDAATPLSSSLRARESQEMLSSTSLRADRQDKTSELPQTFRATARLDIYQSLLQQSVPSKWTGTPVSLRSSMETPRSAEESVASAALSEPKPSLVPAAAPSLCEHSISISEEADLCCICLEEYTTENPMFRGACQHHFHLPCLMEWKQRSTLCPMCCAETLRGVGEFEALQHCIAADPAEVARQKDIARRDAEIAQQLQREYLLQAQRRGSNDGRPGNAARLPHTLRSCSPRGLARLTLPPAAEVSLRLPTTLEAESSGTSQHLGRIARVPSTQHPRRPEGARPQRVTTNAPSRSTQPPVRPSIQSGRRSHSRPHLGCFLM
ncbi:hypothetical protein LSCM1_03467 [Leishmania martiniquensis]|uniref:RING-type E3 ubiquitin transferase n=1 Tax=Leishmania martiniquensis TaxID=1580590 RepID=A0A836KGL3_9TRYP|nr:hypothetical protein LSCM1_03467 [Leishmania martiniquensis]